MKETNSEIYSLFIDSHSWRCIDDEGKYDISNRMNGFNKYVQCLINISMILLLFR